MGLKSVSRKTTAASGQRAAMAARLPGSFSKLATTLPSEVMWSREACLKVSSGSAKVGLSTSWAPRTPTGKPHFCSEAVVPVSMASALRPVR